MSETNILKIVFLIGLIFIEAIRAPHRRRNRQERREKRMVVLYGGLIPRRR